LFVSATTSKVLAVWLVGLEATVVLVVVAFVVVIEVLSGTL
jgi:hypothetical protein